MKLPKNKEKEECQYSEEKDEAIFYLRRFSNRINHYFRGTSLKSLLSKSASPRFLEREDRLARIGPLKNSKRVGKTSTSWSGFIYRFLQVQHYRSIKETFHDGKELNSDLIVTMIEFLIIAVSAVQLEMAFRSSYWQDMKICKSLGVCPNSNSLERYDDLLATNCLRTVIVVLSLVRLFIRAHFLYYHYGRYPSQSKKLRAKRIGAWVFEVVGTLILPIPCIEHMLTKFDTLLWLSAATVFRILCWKYVLSAPYPLRQRDNVTCLSVHLDFKYHDFVVKKVMDEQPFRKILTLNIFVVVISSYLIHLQETMHRDCILVGPSHDNQSLCGPSNIVCDEVRSSDVLWLTTTSFLKIGFGRYAPQSPGGRIIISVAICLVVFINALLFSIVIKKLCFSSMEYRVHAFLFRMGLNHHKEQSAILAVQATVRYVKSYRESLIWHQKQGNELFFRPLSARLPNEVKKKLYLANFQNVLKDITKYNTDGDPVNGFSRHIEVITAALGMTFYEITHLKRTYYRRSRVLEDRRKRANEPVAAPNKMQEVQHESISDDRTNTGDLPLRAIEEIIAGTVPKKHTQTAVSEEPPAWAMEMMTMCQQTAEILQKMQVDIKSISSD